MAYSKDRAKEMTKNHVKWRSLVDAYYSIRKEKFYKDANYTTKHELGQNYLAVCTQCEPIIVDNDISRLSALMTVVKDLPYVIFCAFGKLYANMSTSSVH